MLNKRGQVEDTAEIIIATIGVIFGVVLLTILNASYSSEVDDAKEAVMITGDVGAIDTALLGTDLFNTLKLQVENYTFGELIAYMPRNYETVQDSVLFENILWDKWIISGTACNTDLYNTINSYLSPVYGKYWYIHVYQDDTEIFTCHPPDILYGFGPRTAEMTLPTLNPDEDVRVVLEVYQ